MGKNMESVIKKRKKVLDLSFECVIFWCTPTVYTMKNKHDWAVIDSKWFNGEYSSYREASEDLKISLDTIKRHAASSNWKSRTVIINAKVSNPTATQDTIINAILPHNIYQNNQPKPLELNIDFVPQKGEYYLHLSNVFFQAIQEYATLNHPELKIAYMKVLSDLCKTLHQCQIMSIAQRSNGLDITHESYLKGLIEEVESQKEFYNGDDGDGGKQ